MACQAKKPEKLSSSDWDLDSLRVGIDINSVKSANKYELAVKTKFKGIAKEISAPQSGEWLDLHEEMDVSLWAYISDNQPILPAQKLAITQIGHFSLQQDSICQIGREYLAVFLGRKLIALDSIALPDSAFIGEKLNSSFLIHKVLPNYQPPEAFSLLAITTFSITPSAELKYAFGQSSLSNGCAVVSLSRLGEFSNRKPHFRFYLLRSLKVASHEVGHSLGMTHCATFECNMNGVNHLRELDSKPPYLCPNCFSKLCWRLGISEEKKRFTLLKSFWKKHGFGKYAAYYGEMIGK